MNDEECINLSEYLDAGYIEVETNQEQLERLGLYDRLNYMKVILILKLCPICSKLHEIRSETSCGGYYCYGMIKIWLASPRQFTDDEVSEILCPALST